MAHSRARRVRVGVGAMVLALAGATVAGLTVGASAAVSGSALAKNDPGIGSPEALADPKCDPATKRVKYQSYSAPLCVKPWKDGADNGGATAQGVTAKTIKVAVLFGDLDPSNPAATKGLYIEPGHRGEQRHRTRRLDQGQQRDLQVRVRDVGAHGRVHVREGERSGRSGAARRRGRGGGAEAVRGARRSLADQHAARWAAARCSSRRSRTPGVPFVYPDRDRGDRGQASRQYSLPTAEFIGKQLKGGKAEYADESMQDQPRKFGVLYPSNFDIDYFKAQLKKYGVTLASEASYTVPPGERQPADEQPGDRPADPDAGHQAQGGRRQQPHHDGDALGGDDRVEGHEVPGLVPRDHRHRVPVHRPRRPGPSATTRTCGHTRSA